MTAEEILHKHISKECMDELSENVWPDMIDAMEEYAKQQANSAASDDGALRELVRDKVTAEIEKSYGKFRELEDDRKDYFYTMIGIIDNALKQ